MQTVTTSVDFSGRRGHPDYYDELERLFPRMVERFAEILEEQAALHDAKDEDYSGNVPLNNFRGTDAFGIDILDAVIARMCDKWSRFQVLHRRRKSSGAPPRIAESEHDTMRDSAAYMLIGVVLDRERQNYSEIPSAPPLQYPADGL